MIKKLKDLTEEDVDKICKSSQKGYNCCNITCPLYLLPEYNKSCYEAIQLFKKRAKQLEMDIEVEEDE